MPEKRTVSILHAKPIAPSSRFLFLNPLESRLRGSPTAASISLVLTPKVSRSQPGVVAERQALMTDNAPKMLIVPHTKPAVPLSPNKSDSTVVDPIKAVRAAISTRPPPILSEESMGLEPVRFDILAFYDQCCSRTSNIEDKRTSAMNMELELNTSRILGGRYSGKGMMHR